MVRPPISPSKTDTVKSFYIADRNEVEIAFNLTKYTPESCRESDYTRAIITAYPLRGQIRLSKQAMEAINLKTNDQKVFFHSDKEGNFYIEPTQDAGGFGCSDYRDEIRIHCKGFTKALCEKLAHKGREPLKFWVEPEPIKKYLPNKIYRLDLIPK